MRRSLALFLGGSLAGLAALAFNFLLRLGGAAAFPPESALSAFLKVIPASLEEPMVQQLGDFAGQLGLVSATLVGAVIYGAALLLFDRYLAKHLAGFGLGRFESLLALGVVPWLAFGLVLFPLDGDSVFGIASPYASTGIVWAFPFALFLPQGLFAWIVSLRYRPVIAAQVLASQGRVSKAVGRREFMEKGILGVLLLAGAAIGFTGIGQLFPSQPTLSTGGQGIDLADAPAIFRDPRLATLVDSEVTPNDNFYRVAIDVIDPTVDASTWSLAVDGLVNAPRSYSLQDIQSLPSASQYSTFECVSNKVNGNLISNAKWGGVKVSDILAGAGGAQAGGSYVV